MKRILAIVLCVILCLCVTACTSSSAQANSSKYDTVIMENRLVELYDAHPESVHIYIDTETGVMYMVYANSYGVAIQVMLDAQGYPVVWRGEK